MRRPENLKLKYFLEKMTLCDVWKLYQYLLHYKSSILKFLPAPISPMSARYLQKNSSSFWNSLSPTAFFCFNKKFYKQLQGAAMGSPVSPVIANIYMEHFESLAIPSSPTLIKWWFRYVDDVHSATRKDQVNKLQEHLNSIDHTSNLQ